MPPLGDGLWCGMKRSLPYGSGTGFCLLSSFFFVQNKIYKVFDGILVYVFS